MLPGIFFLGGLAIASIVWIGVVTKVKSEQKRCRVSLMLTLKKLMIPPLIFVFARWNWKNCRRLTIQ